MLFFYCQIYLQKLSLMALRQKGRYMAKNLNISYLKEESVGHFLWQKKVCFFFVNIHSFSRYFIR